MRQQEGGENLDAYRNLPAAIAFDFPAPQPIQYRIRQRIAALEGLRRQHVENLLHLDLDQIFHAHLSAADASLVGSPVNLDLGDELVEIEFRGAPPSQARAGEPARVPGEVIDLTNEPDSPEENPETSSRSPSAPLLALRPLDQQGAQDFGCLDARVRCQSAAV